MFHAVERITNSSTVYAAVKKYSFEMSWLAAARTSATASATAAKARLLTAGSSPQEPRGPERERGEQKAERHRGRPRGAEERRGEGLGEAEHEGAEQRPPYRAHSPKDAHREHQADVAAAD